MIVSQAGGLGPLSKMPSCNVLVLGKHLSVSTFLATNFDLADIFSYFWGGIIRFKTKNLFKKC